MSHVRPHETRLAPLRPDGPRLNEVPSLSHEQLGALYYSRGDSQKAFDQYQEAARLAPRDYAVQKALADFYLVGLGQAQEALQAYQHVLALQPDDIEVLQIAGNLCASMKRFEEGRQYYTRLLSVQPWNAEARAALSALPPVSPPDGDQGTFMNMIHDAQQSLAGGNEAGMDQAIERLLEHKRKTGVAKDVQLHPETFNDIEHIIKQGKDDASIVALERFLRSTPDHAAGHNALGVLYYRTGAPAKSLEHYQAAVSLDPAGLTYRKNLADYLYVIANDTEAALEQYVQVLRANPQDVETLLALAHICGGLGRKGDASVFLETLQAIEPWNQEARQLREALNALDASHTSSPGEGESIAVAGSAESAPRVEDAARQLEQAIRTDPSNAAAHNDLGSLYRQLGRTAEAGSHFEEAVRHDPDNNAYRKNLADYTAVDLGRHEDALRMYVQLLKENPRDVETLTGIGHICEMLGRTDDARSFYRNALDVEPWNSSVREILQRLEPQHG